MRPLHQKRRGCHLSSFEIWAVILGLTVITFITRGFFLLLGERMELSETLQNALRYAPAAALIAIVAPEMFFTQASSDIQINSPYFWGGICSIITFWFSKSMLLTIILGMLAFTAIRLILA
jgi:branched-subunit amino acid transport protein